MGQNKDLDQRGTAEKQRRPPLMEGEREPMSLGLGEVSSFHSLHFRHQSSLVVPTKILTTSLLKKSDTSLIPVGNIFYTLTQGGQRTGSAAEQHLLHGFLVDIKL